MPVTGEQAIQHATEAYQTRDLSLCDLADLDEQAIDLWNGRSTKFCYAPGLQTRSGDTSHAANEAEHRQISFGQPS